MVAQPHPQPIDPKVASAESKPIDTKRCTSCQALLPIGAFGLNKYGRKGYQNDCSECRAQNLRLYRQKRFNSHSQIDDSHIRNVATHNKAILDEVMQHSSMEIRGFNVISMVEFKVFYGPSVRNGLQTLTFFSMDGQLFVELSLSGIADPLNALLRHIQNFDIRLEYDDMGLANSKKLIYYI